MARLNPPVFDTANTLYAGATVSIFTVDVNGAATTTLATIYDSPAGAGTLTNPQKLNSEGRFAAPIYVNEPVIMTVSGPVATHSTGIQAPSNRNRGVWATATLYSEGDIIRDGAAGANTGNTYLCEIRHTSGTWATDLAAVRWSLFTDLSIPVTAAATSATNAAASAAAAAALASDANKYAGSGLGGTVTPANLATTITVSESVASTLAWTVMISRAGVIQRPGVDYTTNGTTTVTFATPFNGSTAVWWLHTGGRLSTDTISTANTTSAANAAAAATSATNAATSETNAAASATTASTAASTASTAATNASNSATTASTAATNASTSATNAATSATNAATSAASASNSATTTTTNATSAANSANSAATSATNAATSASAAATSATNAAASATAAATSATNAATSETNAASSATTAASGAATVTATSSTSLTIGTGSQSFTASTGKSFTPGMGVSIARTSDAAAQRMSGIVTSYNSGTGAMVVSVDTVNGAGTYTDWTIVFRGPAGAQGSAGPPGADTWQVKTTTYTAVNGDRILADTSSAAWTLTLPAGPGTSHVVRIADNAGTFQTNNLTVARNGSTIMGLAEDMIISTPNVSFGLCFNGSTWRIVQ